MRFTYVQRRLIERLRGRENEKLSLRKSGTRDRERRVGAGADRNRHGPWIGPTDRAVRGHTPELDRVGARLHAGVRVEPVHSQVKLVRSVADKLGGVSVGIDVVTRGYRRHPNTAVRGAPAGNGER